MCGGYLFKNFMQYIKNGIGDPSSSIEDMFFTGSPNVISMPNDFDLWDFSHSPLSSQMFEKDWLSEHHHHHLDDSGRGMQKRNFDSELKSLNDRPSNQASICKATSSPKLNGVF